MIKHHRYVPGMGGVGSRGSKLARLEAEQDAQYWNFTRTARGKPVDPNITREIAKERVKMGRIEQPWQLPYEKANRYFGIPKETYIKHVRKAIGDKKPVSEEVRQWVNSQ